MLYHLIIWISIWNCKIAAQPEHSYQIEDIPIEHYVHDDIQQDEIDVELMPRTSKFIPLNNNEPSAIDVQESRYLKYFLDDSNNKNEEHKNSRSKRGTFPKNSHELIEQIKYYIEDLKNKGQFTSRAKRDTTSQDSQKIIENIGKPLELEEIDNNGTVESKVDIKKKEKDANSLDDKFVINDFIRFRRSSSASDQSETNSKRIGAGKFVQRIPDGSLFQAQKLIQETNKQKDITRETRGATKEQWVKQAYPVQRDETVFDDNLQLSSEAARAPRVHFVTNGMTDRDPLDYKFNREPRSGPIYKYSPSDLSTEMDYYQPRFARNYVPRNGRYTNNYYDRYPPREEHYRGQEYPEKPLNYNSDHNASIKKRRIIYYATLPEVPRNSRNDDIRRPYDRYYPRDRYDERYFVPEDYDRYRSRYYEPPRRYDEDRGRDGLYPVKVSTDVKVWEVKKNPERRIFSDVDRTAYPQN